MENKNFFSEATLLEKGIIRITSEINENEMARVTLLIDLLTLKFEEDCIPEEDRLLTLQLYNCPGGSVSHGNAIRDKLLEFKGKIKVECYGQNSSYAIILLLCGTKGYRVGKWHSEYLMHQPLGIVQGQASDIEIHTKHILKSKSELNGFIADKTGRKVKEVARDTDRDNILDVRQALEYGLIDKIG